MSHPPAAKPNRTPAAAEGETGHAAVTAPAPTPGAAPVTTRPITTPPITTPPITTPPVTTPPAAVEPPPAGSDSPRPSVPPSSASRPARRVVPPPLTSGPPDAASFSSQTPQAVPLRNRPAGTGPVRSQTADAAPFHGQVADTAVLRDRAADTAPFPGQAADTAPSHSPTADAVRPAVLSGPVYRSWLATSPADRPARSVPGDSGRPAAIGPASHTQSVPPDVAAPFQALTGLDVAGIAVHRGPAVSEQARAYQARAFTQSGEIFLPDEAGPLEHSEARALLAHELTHAIQQRVLSPSLPDENSALGQELEADASHAEQWYRSGGIAPLRLAHLPVAALLAGHEGLRTAARRSAEPADGTLWASPDLPSGPAATPGVQRLTGDLAPAWPTAEAGQETEPTSGPGGLATVSGSGEANWAPGLTGLSGAADGAAPVSQELAVLAGGQATGAGAGRKELDELAEHCERLIELSGERPADLDDPVSLDELASKVYPLLRSMLRGELLVDRERAGLLADIS
jgi:Domain of unknown function (DUF4157)